jgi:transposase
MTKKKQSTEAAVREIRRRTRRKFAPEEKVRIVLEGLRGEQSVSELCRREGIAANLYYRWRALLHECATHAPTPKSGATNSG